mgnify:CR=1 FL=1
MCVEKTIKKTHTHKHTKVIYFFYICHFVNDDYNLLLPLLFIFDTTTVCLCVFVYFIFKMFLSHFISFREKKLLQNLHNTHTHIGKIIIKISSAVAENDSFFL